MKKICTVNIMLKKQIFNRTLFGLRFRNIYMRRQINHYNRLVSKGKTLYYSNNISSYNKDKKTVG